MQTNERVRSWSDIAGLAVVTIDTGSKVGTLEDFHFDMQTNEIRAIIIKTGLMSHRLLLTQHINGFGTDAITFANEQFLGKPEEHADIVALPRGKDVLSYRVLSEGGTVIGTIGNILLDTTVPSALRVASYQLSAGLRARISGHFPTFAATDVVRYGSDVIVVPDALGVELAKA